MRLDDGPDADVLVVDRAFRIVALEGNRSQSEDTARTFAAAVPIRSLSPLHHLLAVNVDGDGVVLHDDVRGVPLVVFDRGGSDILNVIQAAGLDRVDVVGLFT